LLFEVFDHLFDLLPIGVKLYDLQGRQKKVGGSQVGDFFPFSFITTNATGPKPFIPSINLAIWSVLFFPYRKTEIHRNAEVREESSGTGIRIIFSQTTEYDFI